MDACPNALALSREIGKPCSFGPFNWWINSEFDFYKSPANAVNFMKAFDKGEPVKSYSFEVEY